MMAAALANNADDEETEDLDVESRYQYYNRGEVEAVIVVGAGEEEVNGVYIPDSSYDATYYAPAFTMSGTWNGNPRTFVLSTWTYKEPGDWFIALEPKTRRTYGENEDKSRYSSKPYSSFLGLNLHRPYPPSRDWEKFMGADPPPVITVKFKCSGVPIHSVAVPTTTAFQKLLCSDTLSDIKLVCQDEVIPAHKIILAVSSSYFMALFNGDWKENGTGEIRVNYPSRVVKEVLTLLYTGNVNSKLVQDEPLSFIAVAAEFDIEWLKHLAEPYCIRDLDESKLKKVWQIARQFENVVLKRACIDFARMKGVCGGYYAVAVVSCICRSSTRRGVLIPQFTAFAMFCENRPPRTGSSRKIAESHARASTTQCLTTKFL